MIQSVNGLKVVKITGIYNDQAVYGTKGGESISAYIELDSTKHYEFNICNKTDTLIPNIIKTDFDQILSTFKFTD